MRDELLECVRRVVLHLVRAREGQLVAACGPRRSLCGLRGGAFLGDEMTMKPERERRNAFAEDFGGQEGLCCCHRGQPRQREVHEEHGAVEVERSAAARPHLERAGPLSCS